MGARAGLKWEWFESVVVGFGKLKSREVEFSLQGSQEKEAGHEVS